MTEFNFNQTIEYIDGTRDLNFEAAQKWAREHGTSFEEDVTARKMLGNKLMRFFVIGDKPKPIVIEPMPIPEPTEEELKANKRMERNALLQGTQDRIDRYRNQKELNVVTTDSEEVYKQLLAYTQYLRDYPSGENWWEHSPKDFSTWKEMLTEESDPSGEQEKAG